MLEDFKQDVPDMLDAMQVMHNRIIHGGGQDEDFMLKVFNALETSNDEDFVDFVKKKRDLWEEDELGDDVDALISACTKKYNNIAESNSKKKRMGKDKVQQDDQDSKFLALLTNLMPLITNAYVTNGNGNGDPNGNGQGRGNKSNENNPFSKIEPYRLEFVGDSIVKHGRTLYWCPHHNDGKGMYVTHKPEDHGEWQQRKSASKSGASAGQGPQQEQKQKLELSDSMKAALTMGDLTALTTFLQKQSKE